MGYNFATFMQELGGRDDELQLVYWSTRQVFQELDGIINIRQTWKLCVCFVDRKEGAVEVRSQGEAQQAVQAAADAILGLGRGGNVPQRPPQTPQAPGAAAQGTAVPSALSGLLLRQRLSFCPHWSRRQCLSSKACCSQS